MIARQYDKKIRIVKATFTDDGFGGTIPDEVDIGNFWAEVKQNSAYRDNQVGTSDIKNNYSFKIRSTPKITPDNVDSLFIIYRSKKYVVNDIRYNEELFRETNITANGIEGN